MVGRTNGTCHSTARTEGLHRTTVRYRARGVTSPGAVPLGTLPEGCNRAAGVPLFADGEVLDGLPAEFAVRPGALRLWSPWPAA